ncbi:efflux RND transporter periplasmic adaptor subunit [Massilia pseudoviolaceinigra]|uniref:efflux RND transporter periplasmic adaptor subunit n=1 Tax=Massilia pseudoviolaceinigra TaxID=3057165 RepID=UPI0027967C99|nr:efflux RND transporter periplasmic adaptor subunit [Massilia sp. CCM 9206]MDQ1919616.1 efflux RND transporter periplasmic adaptor subunit [Massilia sp. CCM 9206]
MLRKTMLVLAIATALAACSKDAKEPGKDAKAAAPVQLLVSPEDMLTIQSNALASGPVVTGSVQPERKADLRAEVSAVVLQVLKENGDIVKRGDILVKLDETAIRDSLSSAEQSARAASQGLDQAERQLERMKTLRASGMTSAQAMDDAEVRRNNALSEVSAAKSRAALARQQLARTMVRAPFDGVVSERKVSAGDTASVGKELLKVIDPSSMRFEGHVSADRISTVKVGQAVSFRINGYAGEEFRGVVKRVDPAANEVTRQVEVLVGFAPGSAVPKVSGLYGEGRIEAETKAALMLPEGALVKAGDKAYAWRLRNKTLNKVDLAVGPRDTRTGNYEIKQGLAAGDIVMRNPSSAFKEGQKVELAPAKVAAAPAAVQGK